MRPVMVVPLVDGFQYGETNGRVSLLLPSGFTSQRPRHWLLAGRSVSPGLLSVGKYEPLLCLHSLSKTCHRNAPKIPAPCAVCKTVLVRQVTSSADRSFSNKPYSEIRMRLSPRPSGSGAKLLITFKASLVATAADAASEPW